MIAIDGLYLAWAGHWFSAWKAPVGIGAVGRPRSFFPAASITGLCNSCCYTTDELLIDGGTQCATIEYILRICRVFSAASVAKAFLQHGTQILQALGAAIE